MTDVCRNNVADGESAGSSDRQITPKEWAAYYLSVRPESPTWRDNMRLFRAKRLFEVWSPDIISMLLPISEL